MAVNVTIRILFAMGREGSSRSRFLAFPATVIVFLLFPLLRDSSPAAGPDGPAAVRSAGMALPGRYRRQRPVGARRHYAARDLRNHPRKGEDISRRSDRLESRIPAILT